MAAALERGLSVSMMGCGEDGWHPLEESGVEGVRKSFLCVHLAVRDNPSSKRQPRPMEDPN